jgi:hypothetical protein
MPKELLDLILIILIFEQLNKAFHQSLYISRQLPTWLTHVIPAGVENL